MNSLNKLKTTTLCTRDWVIVIRIFIVKKKSEVDYNFRFGLFFVIIR